MNEWPQRGIILHTEAPEVLKAVATNMKLGGRQFLDIGGQRSGYLCHGRSHGKSSSSEGKRESILMASPFITPPLLRLVLMRTISGEPTGASSINRKEFHIR